MDDPVACFFFRASGLVHALRRQHGLSHEADLVKGSFDEQMQPWTEDDELSYQ